MDDVRVYCVSVYVYLICLYLRFCIRKHNNLKIKNIIVCTIHIGYSFNEININKGKCVSHITLLHDDGKGLCNKISAKCI